VVLVLEYFDGSSLNKAISNTPEKQFTEVVSHALFVKLLQAVAHLHHHRIIHRDVKPENILVSPNLRDLRLVDFNTAKQLVEGGALTVTGTRLYAAPEVLSGDSPSEASDVWSSGLCLHLMLIGQLPVALRTQAKSFSAFARRVVDEPFEFNGRKWKHISKACRVCLARFLEKKRHLRPAAVTLLEDDWVLRGLASSLSQNLRRSKTKCTIDVCPQRLGHTMKRATSR
jgi:serine/threonine protein kinase